MMKRLVEQGVAVQLTLAGDGRLEAWLRRRIDALGLAGVVQLAGATSNRQVRARYVDTYTWKNPRNNASIKWTMPRDEIRVVPASYNPN